MSNSIRFHYLRDANNNPISCIAICFDKETKKVAFAISTLNPSDNFNRNVARDLAVGRLIRNPQRLDLSNETEEITAHLITRKIFEMLSKNTIPFRRKDTVKNPITFRAKKAIDKWLMENSYGFEFEGGGINPLSIIDNLLGLKATLA